MSLTRHLTSSSAAHGRLAFHPDCPRCAATRLYGDLGADRLAALRTQAAVAAGALAFSAAAPPATALASGPPDQEQEGSIDPGAEAPGIDPDFDPGDDGDHDDFDTGPDLGANQDDDSNVASPVEPEPYSTPDALVLPDTPPALEPPAAPPAPVAPAPPPEPAPPTPPPAALAPTPLAPAHGPLASDKPDSTRPAATDKKPRPKDPARERPDRGPAADAAPALSAAPVVVEQNTAPAATGEALTVSQPAAEPAPQGQVAGASYRVRPGDSLWSIARRRLGAGASNGQLAREVARLWRLNEDRIGTGDPSMLHVGTVLRLR